MMWRGGWKDICEKENGLNGQDGQSIGSMESIRSKRAGAAANAALVLIGVAMALLDRQIAAQAKTFETEGGFTERLYRTRQSRRRDQR